MTALFYFDTTISGVGSLVFLRATTKKVVNFFEEKSASGDLSWGFYDLEKWPGSFTALAFAPDDLPHDLSDLKMTWLPWCPGAATGYKRPRSDSSIWLHAFCNLQLCMWIQVCDRRMVFALYTAKYVWTERYSTRAHWQYQMEFLSELNNT